MLLNKLWSYFNSSLSGCYCHIAEPAKLKITKKKLDNNEIFEFVARNSATNEMKTKEFIISNQTFIRWDNSLVSETTSVGLFGGTEKDAQVFSRRGSYLIRYIYLNYWFKGFFGGYWGADKHIHYWCRIEDDKCDFIEKV
jgi:hypothetical protein